MIGEITRDDIKAFLAVMDRYGVDQLKICPYCRQGTITLEPVDGYLLPLCNECISKIRERAEAYRIEREAWEHSARAGHYYRRGPRPYDAGGRGYMEAGPGWVYLARTNFGTVKIGATRRSVSERCHRSFGRFIHAVYTEFPFELEGMLHRRFAVERAHGEYFNLSPEQIDEVRRIQTVNGKEVIHCSTMPREVVNLATSR